MFPFYFPAKFGEAGALVLLHVLCQDAAMDQSCRPNTPLPFVDLRRQELVQLEDYDWRLATLHVWQ